MDPLMPMPGTSQSYVTFTRTDDIPPNDDVMVTVDPVRLVLAMEMAGWDMQGSTTWGITMSCGVHVFNAVRISAVRTRTDKSYLSLNEFVMRYGAPEI